MTPIQYKIFQFIQTFMQENGYAPLLKEIAVGVGISPKSKSFISGCVHTLVEKGLLVMEEKGRPRNFQLHQARGLQLPLVGRIAAGAPIEAIATHETLDLSGLFAGENHFVLEVKGDSMIEEGILDGDKVICRFQSMAKEGDIVVALIDNHEATLKRIHYPADGKIILLPANAKLKPQLYLANQVQIQGIFIGLLRLHKKG